MEGEGLLGSVQAITATEVGVSAHATAASVSLTVLLVVLAVFGFIYRAKHDSGSPSHVTIAVEPGPSCGKEELTELRSNDVKPSLVELEKEWWFPKMDTYVWNEVCELDGCPWNFEGCETVQDAIFRVWRQPLPTQLQESLQCLLRHVKNVKVVRCTLAWPLEVHFAVVYTLQTGAEIFGGAPIDQAIGVELSTKDESENVGHGLRRRRQEPQAVRTVVPCEAPDLPLPCLAPFFRVHDGMGVLLSAKHLPLLLEEPLHTVKGSCYYLYPTRAIQEYGGRRGLVRFARVDSKCFACADTRLSDPFVVYAEVGADLVEDDEGLLDFLAGTVSNISGEEVTSAWHFSGSLM
mmetsp:Transcript_6510/g.15894  ORF Transcript_6510/g.15894 Transcript_6510/m.15894 type:complete len:349 (-) Transcript_6510:28-1074(-)